MGNFQCIRDAVAAPSPEIEPEAQPLLKVRRMQRTPIGPTGAAIENPMTIPFSRKMMAMGSGNPPCDLFCEEAPFIIFLANILMQACGGPTTSVGRNLIRTSKFETEARRRRVLVIWIWSKVISRMTQ
jgi:hypothetical protein